MSDTTRLLMAIGKKVWADFQGADPQAPFDREAVANGLEAKGVPNYHALPATLLAEWFDNGLPQVVIGHKHAASLMCTTMAAADVPDLVAPWSVFYLPIPTGMAVDPEGVPLAGMLVVDIVEPSGDRHVTGMTIGVDLKAVTGMLVVADTIADLVHDNAKATPLEQLLARYLVGAVAELAAHRPAQDGGRRLPLKTDQRGRPETRTFVLTRNVKVDCRPAVARFLSGKGHAAPSVQVLVRGHWKRQAHGPERAERRWQHIEPYWRGPEDAPIALRAHVVAGAP